MNLEYNSALGTSIYNNPPDFIFFEILFKKKSRLKICSNTCDKIKQSYILESSFIPISYSLILKFSDNSSFSFPFPEP